MRFAALSGAHVGSQSEAFTEVLSQKPELVVMLGDMHYAGHRAFSQEQFKFALREVMRSPSMRALYSSVPITYMIDDHDACERNCNSNSVSLFKTKEAYEQVVPGMNQASYLLAGVRFI